MAGSRISGITIEINGDTTKLQTSLRGVDNQLKTTQNNLKDINKLLKLDPKNTELLTQKQKNLEQAITNTKKRLEELKNAQFQVAEGTPEWDALQREIIATEQNLQGLEKEYKNFGSVAAQQIKAAGEQMVEFGNKVTAAGQALKPVSAAASALVTGMVGLGYNALRTADDLSSLSQQTGLSTDSLQKMTYASDLVDVSLDTITSAVTKMKKNMAGTGDAFDRLGVSVTDASGHMRRAEDVFYDTLRALSRIPNETERDQIAMEIFGKSADQLAGIIDDGGEALRMYGAEAEQLGLILSGDTLTALNATNDAVDRAKAQFKAAAIQLGATIAQGLLPLVEKITAGVQKLTGWLQKLTPAQTNVIMTIAGIIAVLAPLLIIGGKLITGIGMLMTFAPMLVAAFSPVTLIIIGITAAIIALVAAGIWLKNNWEDIKEGARIVWGDIVNTFTNAKEKLLSSIRQFGAAAKQSFIDTWNNVKSTVTGAWNRITDDVTSGVDRMKDAVKERFDQIVEAVRDFVDRLKSLFDFEWKLPHIALPHFWISGTFSLNPPRVPTFGVNWYKKAYDNPMLFTSPTVMQTPYGLKGFGDGGRGGELVYGRDQLMRDIAEVSGGDNITINVYAPEGMDINVLASKIQSKLVALQKQRSLAYGS